MTPIFQRAVWDHVYQGLAFLGNGNGDADFADVVFNDPEDAQRAVNGLTEDGWSISFATLAEVTKMLIFFAGTNTHFTYV